MAKPSPAAKTAPIGRNAAAADDAGGGIRAAPARRRRWPWAFGALVLLLLAVVAWLARLLEPERLSALLLREAEQRSGLALSVAEPAEVSFWPDLHIRLQGLRAAQPGGGPPLLTVAAVELVLPWSALLQREARIRALRLRQPVLERDLLARWLQSLPDRHGTAVQLPELTASLVVIDGSIVASALPQAWQLHALALDTTALRSGRPFGAVASGRVEVGGRTVAGTLEVETVPASASGTLVLDPIALLLRDGEGRPVAEAAGNVRWGPADALSIALALTAGILPAPALEWLPAAADATPAQVTIIYAGTTALDGPMQAQLRHPAATATLSGIPLQLLAWWNGGAHSPLPPAAGTLAVPVLRSPGVRLEGVQLQLDAGEATTPAGSASTDAAATGAEPPR